MAGASYYLSSCLHHTSDHVNEISVLTRTVIIHRTVAHLNTVEWNHSVWLDSAFVFIWENMTLSGKRQRVYRKLVLQGWACRYHSWDTGVPRGITYYHCEVIGLGGVGGGCRILTLCTMKQRLRREFSIHGHRSLLEITACYKEAHVWQTELQVCRGSHKQIPDGWVRRRLDPFESSCLGSRKTKS